LKRLRDVWGGNIWFAGQVGDRPRQFQNPMESSRSKLKLDHSLAN
jgi:hypothetical protein